jgi:hypothetical protein
LTAKFAATAETQSVLHELEEKMRRIDLDASMLSDEVLLKSAHQLKTAGMKLDGGGKRVDDIEINRYQLLHVIVTLRDDDRMEAMETRVFHVSRFWKRGRTVQC